MRAEFFSNHRDTGNTEMALALFLLCALCASVVQTQF